MSAIKEVYNDLESNISTVQKENAIYTIFTKIISNAYTQLMQTDEGYCFKFTLPITAINKLYQDIGIDPIRVLNAYKKDWGSVLTSMHKDSYYQILLLILYYAIQNNKQPLAENALTIILMKIWNGRKHRMLKYCDKRVMNYVVNNMMTNRHVINKYDNPLSLIKDYFVPTLLKKYAPEIKQDIGKLKRIFEQCYARIFQLWTQNARMNLQTNKKEAQNGILPLYIKAKQEGLYMQSTSIRSGEDQESSFDQYSSISNRDEIVTKTVDNITMNPNPQYPAPIIQNINRNTSVSNKIIEKILSSMHNHQNHDLLTEILSIILTRTNIVDKTDICDVKFKADIKRYVIGSKNNADIKKLQSLLNSLLEKILPKIANIQLSSYSNVHQMQIRNVIIYGLEYNLIKTICR